MTLRLLESKSIAVESPVALSERIAWRGPHIAVLSKCKCVAEAWRKESTSQFGVKEGDVETRERTTRSCAVAGLPEGALR